MPGRVRLNIRLPHRARELSTRKPLIWRWSIGHYGGYFVDVPAQNIYLFRSRFPANVLPRRGLEKDASVWQTMTNAAAMKFEALFPESKGLYYKFKFSDRSLGASILENGRILQDESAERPDLSD